MIKADKSKRTFFKKMAAAVGFVAAARYLSKLMVASTNSIQVINDNNVNENNKQKNAWLRKQWVPMTDNEKKQMLDELLEIHNKYNA